MGLKIIDVVAALALNLIQCVHTDHILSCNASAWAPCPGDNQICNQTSSECVCMKNFVLVGDTCEAPDDDLGLHSTTTIVVTIFALALIICGLVLVIRKYSLLDYVRQKINMNRNNDIMYEDVMIGNDDPPLSP